MPLWVPDPWNIAPAKHLFHDLLTTLTGDRWDIHLRSGGRGNPKQGRLVGNWQAADVALLSGGLDSTAFAAWMARRARGEVLFVVFYDPHTKHRQAETIGQISALWGVLSTGARFRRPYWGTAVLLSPQAGHEDSCTWRRLCMPLPLMARGPSSFRRTLSSQSTCR